MDDFHPIDTPLEDTEFINISVIITEMNWIRYWNPLITSPLAKNILANIRDDFLRNIFHIQKKKYLASISLPLCIDLVLNRIHRTITILLQFICEQSSNFNHTMLIEVGRLLVKLLSLCFEKYAFFNEQAISKNFSEDAEPEKKVRLLMVMEEKINSLIRWLKKSDDFWISEHICVKEDDVAGRGVKLSGRSIKQNQRIVTIPSSYQLNFHTVLCHISNFNRNVRIPNINVNSVSMEPDRIKGDPRYRLYETLDQKYLLHLSSFQLLELYILEEWVLLPLWSNNQIKSFWEPYFTVWPCERELKSFPAVWKCSRNPEYKSLINYLPTASKNHMLQMSNLIKSDWRTISPILRSWNELFHSQLSLEDQFERFLHIYCIINSRCLYADVPLKKNDNSSKFTMVPFVDFLNHTQDVDLHTYPRIEPPGALGPFSIYCGKHVYVVEDEEILLNYGAHSNDFLINEYGFVIPNNKWNYIDITPEIISRVKNSRIKTFLQENAYWGDYTINAEDVSYRVIVALSLIVTGDFRRAKKLLMGHISEDFFLPKIGPVLYEILMQLKSKSIDALRMLEKEKHTTCHQNLIIIHRDYIKILERNLSKTGTPIHAYDRRR